MSFFRLNSLFLLFVFSFLLSCTQGERKWVEDSTPDQPTGLFGVKTPSTTPTLGELEKEPYLHFSGVWTNEDGRTLVIHSKTNRLGRLHRTFLLGHSVAPEHSPSSHYFGIEQNPDAPELRTNSEGDIYAQRRITLQGNDHVISYFFTLVNKNTLELFWRSRNETTGTYTDKTEIYSKGNFREQQEKLTQFMNARKLNGRRIAADMAEKRSEECLASSRGDNRSRTLRDSISQRDLNCARKSIDQGYQPSVADLEHAVKAQYKPMVSLLLDNQTYRGPRLMSALREVTTLNRMVIYPDNRVVNFSDDFTDIGRTLLTEGAEVELSDNDLSVMIEMSAKRPKGLGFTTELLESLTEERRLSFYQSSEVSDLLAKLVKADSEAPYFEGLDILLHILTRSSFVSESITPALEAAVISMNGEAFSALYSSATKDRARLNGLLKDSALSISRQLTEVYTYQEKLKMIEKLNAGKFIYSILNSSKI